MRHFYLLLIACALYGGQAFGQAKTTVLVFDETGKLLNEPPTMVRGGEKVCFRIQVNREFLHQRSLEAYLRYQRLAKSLKNVDAYLARYGFADFGGGKRTTLKGVLEAAQFEMGELLIHPRLPSIRNEVQPLPSSAVHNVDHTMMAKFQDLVIPDYELVLSYFDERGLPFSPPVEKSDFPVLTQRFDPEPWVTEKEVGLPTACRRVHYQVRQKNGIYTAITNLISLPTSLKNLDNDELIPIIKRLQTFQEVYEAAVKALEESDKLFGQGNPVQPDGFYNAYNCMPFLEKFPRFIETVKKYQSFLDSKLIDPGSVLYPIANGDGFDWMARFLWLNPGDLLANPFLREPEDVSGEIDKINAAIAVAQERLAGCDKDLESLKTLLSAVENPDPKKMPDYLSEQRRVLADRQNEQKTLTNLQQAKNKLVRKGNKSESDVLARQDSLTQDKFLYRGQLEASESESSGVFVRYHDASQQYQLMGRFPPTEATEKQRMVVQIENQRPNVPVRLKYEFKQIQYSLSALEEEITRTKDVQFDFTRIKAFAPPAPLDGGGGNIIMTDEATLRKFVKSYKQTLIFREGSVNFPLPALRDTLPEFTSFLLAVPDSTQPPYLVPYSIVTRVKGKDSSLTDEKLRLSFRVNKLHRFRFKMGLLYSWHDAFDYEVKDNVPSVTTNRRGLDATFGLQVFPRPIDIRDRHFGLRPFAYVGFSITKRAFENYFLGGGFEIFNGLALSGGVHIGKTERLNFQNGIFSVDANQWRVGPYASILLDLSVFNTVFNFSGIKNPFN